MEYYFRKVIEMNSFEDAMEAVIEALRIQGFGLLSSIDMQVEFERRMDIDFRKYTILGVCNPLYAYEALQKDEEIGLLLPCNIVVQETARDGISVSISDPEVVMSVVGDPELEKIAEQLKNQLMKKQLL